MASILTLSRKIQGFVIALISLIASFIFFYVPSQERILLTGEFKQKVEALAETVVLGMTIGLSSGDMTAIPKVLDFAKSNESTRFVVIVSEGTTFASIPEKFQYSPELEKSDTLVIVKKPLKTDAINGEIIVGCSTALIELKTSEVRSQALILAVGLMFFGFVASWLLKRAIVAPIRKLSTAAEKVGNGDLTQIVEVRTNDEIGKLAHAFNQMVSRLRELVNSVNEQREYLSSNIQKLSIAAEKVGNGDLTQIVEVRTNDEIGKLAHAFNQMVVRLRELVSSVNEQREYLSGKIQIMLRSVDSLSNGDLTQQIPIEKNDDIGHLFSAYNEAVSQIRYLVEQVTTSVSATVSASEQITTISGTTTDDIQEQSLQIRTVSVAMEEMAASVHHSSQQAVTASQSAHEAQEDAQNSDIIIQGLINNVEQVSSTVRASAERISALGESSQQIGEIILVIDEIADQTNLLALNAAIEAARAGEQGRGFAVVADEVRKLAERTQKATKEIRSMISSIQKNTQEVVVSMSRGTRLVDESTEYAEKTSASMKAIVSKTSQVAELINQVASTGAQQSATVSDSARNMDSINAASDRTTQAAISIAKTAGDLQHLTSDLQRLVGNFTITNQSPLSGQITTTRSRRVTRNRS